MTIVSTSFGWSSIVSATVSASDSDCASASDSDSDSASDSDPDPGAGAGTGAGAGALSRASGCKKRYCQHIASKEQQVKTTLSNNV